MTTDTLPELPTPKYTETIRGVPCITVTEHEHLMRAYALQALAQVQGVPFGYIHHFVAHDDSGVIIDATWEADGCADPLPHPTFPSMWKWSHATLFYTTPQPAQATQAEVTPEEVMRAAKEATAPEWQDVVDGWHMGLDLMKFTRLILALRPVQSGLTGCNCRWDGDTQVQWCELHLAHKEAIHEWAERAKEAEKQLALRPAAAPMTPASRDVIMATRTANADAEEWPEPWAYQRGWNNAEAHHGITAQAKKETP